MRMQGCGVYLSRGRVLETQGRVWQECGRGAPSLHATHAARGILGNKHAVCPNSHMHSAPKLAPST